MLRVESGEVRGGGLLTLFNAGLDLGSRERQAAHLPRLTHTNVLNPGDVSRTWPLATYVSRRFLLPLFGVFGSSCSPA